MSCLPCNLLITFPFSDSWIHLRVSRLSMISTDLSSGLHEKRVMQTLGSDIFYFVSWKDSLNPLSNPSMEDTILNACINQNGDWWQIWGNRHTCITDDDTSRHDLALLFSFLSCVRYRHDLIYLWHMIVYRVRCLFLSNDRLFLLQSFLFPYNNRAVIISCPILKYLNVTHCSGVNWGKGSLESLIIMWHGVLVNHHYQNMVNSSLTASSSSSSASSMNHIEEKKEKNKNNTNNPVIMIWREERLAEVTKRKGRASSSQMMNVLSTLSCLQSTMRWEDKRLIISTIPSRHFLSLFLIWQLGETFIYLRE